MAEGRTVEQALMMSSAWRLRLIGSQSPLPSPRGSDVNSLFQVMEIRDYYVPNNGRPIVRLADDSPAPDPPVPVNCLCQPSLADKSFCVGCVVTLSLLYSSAV